MQEAWRQELEKMSHRPYTTGFALGQPGPEDQVYSTSSYEQTADFVGLIQGYDPETGRVTIEQRNHVKEGERLEILNPDGEIFAWTVTEMQNDQGEPITAAPHAQMVYTAKGFPDGTLVPGSWAQRKKQTLKEILDFTGLLRVK